MKKKCFLYEGLFPCVELGRELLLYSPFNRNIALVERNLLNSLNRERLNKLFFEREKATRREKKKQITFINTTDCLQKCIYCFNDAGTRRTYLSSDVAIGILDEFLYDNPHSVLIKFFGGEPSLNVRLIKAAVHHVKQKGITASFSIVTGGYVLPDTLSWMIANDFSFTVSMDGTPEIQTSHRPLIKGQKNLLSPGQTIDVLAKNGAAFKVRMTVTDRNVYQLADSVDYFHSMGARVIHIEPVNLSGRALKTKVRRPEPKLFSKNLITAIDTASKKGMKVINSSYMDLLESEKHYCSSGMEHFVVGVNGEISLCYEISNECDPMAEKMIFGRYNMDSRKIDFFKAPEDIRCGVDLNLSAECASCFAKYTCGGGCPSRNLADSKGLLNPGGYFCEITKLVFPEILVRVAVSANLLNRN